MPQCLWTWRPRPFRQRSQIHLDRRSQRLDPEWSRFRQVLEAPKQEVHVADERPPRTQSEPDAFLPPRIWRQFDDLDLEAELKHPVRTVREPPMWFREGLLQAYGVALRQ